MSTDTPSVTVTGELEHGMPEDYWKVMLDDIPDIGLKDGDEVEVTIRKHERTSSIWAPPSGMGLPEDEACLMTAEPRGAEREQRFIVRHEATPPLDGWQIYDTVTDVVTHADDHTPEAETHQREVCRHMNMLSTWEQDRLFGMAQEGPPWKQQHDRRTSLTAEPRGAEREQRMQDLVKAVRDLYLHIPKSMFVQPRFWELWRALHCLDGPLFSNEPDLCTKPDPAPPPTEGGQPNDA